MMKAIVYEKYGTPDVLEITEVEKPNPNSHEVQVKVHAASIAFGDNAAIRGEPIIARLWSGLLKPKFKIPGSDFAGTVESVGADVTKFKPGDEVFGDLSECGWGCFAEYVCAREDAIAIKPGNLSFEECSAIPVSAVTAIQGLRFAGEIKAGQKILINGASGGVGSFAVQIAKSFGAEVTAVCSTDKIKTAKAIGADFVIDYNKTNFTKEDKTYDLILGVNGFHSLSEYKRVLNPNGTYVQIGGSGAQIMQAMLLGPILSKSDGRKLCSMGVAKPSVNDLDIIRDFAESGTLKPEIEQIYPFSQTREAFQHFNRRHLKGKLVVSICVNC